MRRQKGTSDIPHLISGHRARCAPPIELANEKFPSNNSIFHPAISRHFEVAPANLPGTLCTGINFTIWAKQNYFWLLGRANFRISWATADWRGSEGASNVITCSIYCIINRCSLKCALCRLKLRMVQSYSCFSYFLPHWWSWKRWCCKRNVHLHDGIYIK